MSPLRRALWGLAAAGFALGLIVAALALTSDHLELRGLWVALMLVNGWGWIGVGLFAWGRRPDNRIGSLMVLTGFLWLVGGVGLSDVPLLFSVGQVLGSVFFVAAIHVLLAFPSGRLETVGQRRIVLFGYLLATVLLLPAFLFTAPEDLGCARCPDNAFLIEPNHSLADAIDFVINGLAVLLIGAVLVSLARRWRRATPPQRRLMRPVLSAGVALLVLLGALLAVQNAGFHGSAMDAAYYLALLPFGLVPYVFLGSLARTRIIQGGAVGELVGRLGGALGPGELRDALARALRDRSLELVYWLPSEQSFVDPEGRPVELPDEGSGRAVTKVERDGDCVAAIVHDASLLEDRRLVDAVGAAAALALDNERLDAELRANLEQLRSSRERMLRVGLEERRRLERNLHDGAQQRLVAMALNMRLARTKLREDPEGADALLESAGRELDAALAELRELARGIHPALLSDRGLDAALETLTRRSPVPVELEGMPEQRLPEAVELAAYYVVAESLTNVTKYARASHATVNVERENGKVLVEVSDDGVGGADPARGSGLQGLADRLSALDGRLEVDSEPGRGTVVRARIPCG